MPTGAQVCLWFFKSHYIRVLKNAIRHSVQKNITNHVLGTGVNRISCSFHWVLLCYELETNEQKAEVGYCIKRQTLWIISLNRLLPGGSWSPTLLQRISTTLTPGVLTRHTSWASPPGDTITWPWPTSTWIPGTGPGPWVGCGVGSGPGPGWSSKIEIESKC